MEFGWVWCMMAHGCIVVRHQRYFLDENNLSTTIEYSRQKTADTWPRTAKLDWWYGNKGTLIFGGHRVCRFGAGFCLWTMANAVLGHTRWTSGRWRFWKYPIYGSKHHAYSLGWVNTAGYYSCIIAITGLIHQYILILCSHPVHRDERLYQLCSWC